MHKLGQVRSQRSNSRTLPKIMTLVVYIIPYENIKRGIALLFCKLANHKGITWV